MGWIEKWRKLEKHLDKNDIICKSKIQFGFHSVYEILCYEPIKISFFITFRIIINKVNKNSIYDNLLLNDISIDFLWWFLNCLIGSLRNHLKICLF